MCYFISTEKLIANVLINKASTQNIGRDAVETNVSELEKVFEFSFMELHGNCVFEISSKDVLGAISLYPEYFKYKKNSYKIVFSDPIKTSDSDESFLAMFSIPTTVTNTIFKFFENKVTK